VLGVLILAALLAPFGIGPSRLDWRLRWTDRPLPAGYTTAMLTAQIGLEWRHYIDEFARTIAVARRAKPRGR